MHRLPTGDRGGPWRALAPAERDGLVGHVLALALAAVFVDAGRCAGDPDLAAAALAVLAGLFFDISALEWVAVSLCIALVLALEALNTALEYLTDLVSPEHHPLAGKAKDAAAAAVLIGAAGAAITGFIIFLPKIFALAA